MAENYINLWVGYDLGNAYSQISCYNERKNEVDSICLPGKKAAYEIPTKLSKKSNGDEWFFGEDAEAHMEEPWIFIRDFLVHYEDEPTMMIGGETFEKKALLFKFVTLSLELIGRYYPHGKVEWLTFTAPEFSRKLIEDLLELGRTLDIAPEKLKIQNHVASYENYALCQPKELWQHDVGMFEYNDTGLSYCHLTINRKRSPMVIQATTLALGAYLNGEDYKVLSPVELDRRFLNVIKEVLGNRNVSTIYLVGRGFEGDWMNMSLKIMCSNRKGFIGQNLYAKGACYNSMLEATKSKNQTFIALNDEIVPENIYLQVTRGRESFRYDLVKAGSDWYNIQETAEFILDGTDTIPLHVRDFVTNKERLIPLKLESMPQRPNRTTRIHMHLEFEDSNICNVIMEDKGFGSLFPGTGKTWKKRLNVVEYESPDNFEITGRLILNREVAERVPYYFNMSGMKVFSVEELCYYIYENIYAVNMDTFGEDLLYWLEKNMNEVSLTRGLKNLIKGGSTLKEIIRYFMNYVDYYTAEECKHLMQIIDDLSHQNPTESKKLEADNYIRYCRYMEAIRVYNDVIYDMEHQAKDEVTREFKGDTWHNLGVTYTRVMNFSAAQECFKRAWRLNQNENSLKSFLWISKLMLDETSFFDAVENSSLEEDDINAILGEFDRVQAAAGSDRNERLKLVRDINNDKSSEMYHQRMAGYLDELKEWYRG